MRDFGFLLMGWVELHDFDFSKVGSTELSNLWKVFAGSFYLCISAFIHGFKAVGCSSLPVDFRGRVFVASYRELLIKFLLGATIGGERPARLGLHHQNRGTECSMGRS